MTTKLSNVLDGLLVASTGVALANLLYYLIEQEPLLFLFSLVVFSMGFAYIRYTWYKRA